MIRFLVCTDGSWRDHKLPWQHPAQDPSAFIKPTRMRFAESASAPEAVATATVIVFTLKAHWNWFPDFTGSDAG